MTISIRLFRINEYILCGVGDASFCLLYTLSVFATLSFPTTQWVAGIKKNCFFFVLSFFKFNLIFFQEFEYYSITKKNIQMHYLFTILTLTHTYIHTKTAVDLQLALERATLKARLFHPLEHPQMDAFPYQLTPLEQGIHKPNKSPFKIFILKINSRGYSIGFNHD